MQIEIWSDVVCPWCYIGKRRFERALAEFPHADQVEVVYRSFELDPSAPEVGTESVADNLGRKYGGGPAAGREMIARTVEAAASEGLAFDYAHATHTKTVDVHRLLHLALAEGGPERQRGLKEALLEAYFTRGESMGDPAVLRRVAVDAGLDATRVDEVLSSGEFGDAVAEDVAQARAYGAGGVPFFVVDRRFGVSGAQPTEVFTQVLDQAWEAAHPQLATWPAAGDQAEVCGPDGCPT
jgi:predicted DsbA family dithiol-disulfide isomerase